MRLQHREREIKKIQKKKAAWLDISIESPNLTSIHRTRELERVVHLPGESVVQFPAPPTHMAKSFGQGTEPRTKPQRYRSTV